MSKMTKNGVSTTVKKGQFQFEQYYAGSVIRGVLRVQWDYRDTRGDLHSGISTTVAEAKAQARLYGYKGN